MVARGERSESINGWAIPLRGQPGQLTWLSQAPRTKYSVLRTACFGPRTSVGGSRRASCRIDQCDASRGAVRSQARRPTRSALDRVERSNGDLTQPAFDSLASAYSNEIDQAARDNIRGCRQHDGDDDAGKYVESDSHLKGSSATDGFGDIHDRFLLGQTPFTYASPRLSVLARQPSVRCRTHVQK